MEYTKMEAAGWQRVTTTAFTAALGPIWTKGKPGARIIGLLAHDGLLNDYGLVMHGGALMTFTDIAFGIATADALPGRAYLTVQLQYQFAGSARAGNLISCKPELVRKTSQFAFMRSLILADDEVIGSADGIFKASERR